MKIICTLNLKGGCAKTTTAVSMAELLATGFKSKHGTVKPGKVLLFDNDKQGNASRLFDAYQGETESPAAAVLKNATFKGNTIRHTKLRIWTLCRAIILWSWRNWRLRQYRHATTRQIPPSV